MVTEERVPAEPTESKSLQPHLILTCAVEFFQLLASARLQSHRFHGSDLLVMKKRTLSSEGDEPPAVPTECRVGVFRIAPTAQIVSWKLRSQSELFVCLTPRIEHKLAQALPPLHQTSNPPFPPKKGVLCLTPRTERKHLEPHLGRTSEVLHESPLKHLRDCPFMTQS